MPDLKKKVLFSSGQYNAMHQWWTFSNLLTKNLFILIFVKNCPNEKIPLQFIKKLKEQLEKLKIPISLKIIQKIINNPNIINDKNLSILLISYDFDRKTKKTKINFASKGDIEAKLISQTKIVNLPLNTIGLMGTLSKGQVIFFSNKNFSNQFPLKDILNNSVFPKLALNNLKINPNPNNFLILKTKTQKKFVLPSLPNFKKILSKSHKDFSTPSLLPKNPFSFSSLGLSLREKKTPLLSQKRFYALITAAIFLMILGFSVGFGSYKKQKTQAEIRQRELVENVTYKLKQAESLKNLNSSRAKTLLKEAKDTLDSYSQNNKVENLDLENLSKEVNNAYASITQKYFIDAPEIFFDLSIAKNDFHPTSLSLAEFSLTLFDPSEKILLTLDIQNKSSDIIGAKDYINNETFLTSIEDWIILGSKDTIQIIDKNTKKQTDSFRLEKIQIDQLVGYANNAYVLDKKLGQVWRLRGAKNTFQKPDSFFAKNQDFSQVSSFSLDGSLWFLLKDGGIEKYTSGIKDAYYPPYILGLDEPITNPNKIYTDEYLENLYILDSTNKRIVVFSKNGQYRGQYLCNEIGMISDFVVSEKIGKILLLYEDKIYDIDLKSQI